MTDKERGQKSPAKIEVPKHERSPQGGLVVPSLLKGVRIENGLT